MNRSEWLAHVERLCDTLGTLGTPYTIIVQGGEAAATLALYEFVPEKAEIVSPEPEIVSPEPETVTPEAETVSLPAVNGPHSLITGEAEKEEPPHAHHWKLDGQNGPTSEGRCECGATRTFRNSSDATTGPHAFEEFDDPRRRGPKICRVCRKARAVTTHLVEGATWGEGPGSAPPPELALRPARLPRLPRPTFDSGKAGAQAVG